MLGTVATTTGAVDQRIAAAARGLSMITNLVDSGTNERKNWYLYRFLDDRLRSPAIEWRISKRVLEQYGPLMRGSVLLTFHGQPSVPAPADQPPVELVLRPNLGFHKKDPLALMSTTEGLKEGDQIPTRTVSAHKSGGHGVRPVGPVTDGTSGRKPTSSASQASGGWLLVDEQGNRGAVASRATRARSPPTLDARRRACAARVRRALRPTRLSGSSASAWIARLSTLRVRCSTVDLQWPSCWA